ncbi:MAG: hypothetical protein ACI9S8_001447 [Chlamydiales bacterium]|jgi:hypothetical protein
MDGLCPSKKEIHSKVDEWFYQVFETRHSGELMQKDIDEFFKDKIAKQDWIFIATTIFKRLLNLCLSEGIIEEFSPKMTIPMRYLDSLKTWDPSLSLEEELVKRPPGIYLTNRDNRKRLVRGERYDVTIEHPSLVKAFEEFMNGIHIRYVCFRNMEEIEDDEEYFRYIEVEFFPPGMIL